MFTKTAAFVAIAFAGTLAAGTAVAADDHKVTVALHVNTDGVDLARPEGARSFYARLRQASYVVCTRGTRVDLVPVDNERRCIEKALGQSIRSAKQPLLTQVYLEDHTLQQAAAYGIELPVQVAAK
jgi:UrcA family protein